MAMTTGSPGMPPERLSVVNDDIEKKSKTSRTVFHTPTIRTRPPLLLHPVAAARARPPHRLGRPPVFLLPDPRDGLDDTQTRFQRIEGLSVVVAASDGSGGSGARWGV
jgi:hypothetical protein